MKINIKHLGFYALLGMMPFSVTSCNDLLDLEPVSQITSEVYYETADQLASYLNNYYNSFLQNPYNGYMYHEAAYNDGMARSDRNTDIFVQGISGNTTLFADDYWEVPTDKNMQSSYFSYIRICNYFLEQVLPKYEAGEISGEEELIKNYIGEAYFMRALTYYRALVVFGDFPIVTTVLEDNNDEVVEASKRSPRNEVARFILEDLDKAIDLLASRSKFSGQRLNREAALLFKSRVALYEGTFEKYHRNSGRVPGDSEWPGANADYNSGKIFGIDGEFEFFLTEAIAAAEEVAGTAQLTSNNHVIEPTVGVTTGWNPYFEMYSQPSLANVTEVLLWKEYNSELSVKHNAPYRCKIGCADGYTRTFVEAFLMKNGLPIYAENSGYQGDTSIDNAKKDRDERLQLFVWGESTILDTDESAPTVGTLFSKADITASEDEKRCITGYQPRKYYTYDYEQTTNDEIRGTNACPIFRVAEAMLNYMEASYELTGTLNSTALGYWKALRERAGVSTDVEATIAATDLSKEGDFGVYSGTSMVDKTLYNIRRERMAETFSEGLRYTDLLRWRSFDNMLSDKWIPEGVNFWDGMYRNYMVDSDGNEVELVADGSDNAIVSSSELSKYLRPYSRTMSSTNALKDGYNWHKAYYLYPISIADMQYASPDGSKENTYLYQNIYWPNTGGGHAEE
ncbi:RagB/SusD family nutrient uptake outer membrane protein [Bacteroides fragilis]|uniref:RagB/SusD family nutrient uptake outer membrane protein n=1 Tax=Bacteroides fragilis TaxID=817 RepID=UPI0024557E2C|nr:RagB/SusD family nutrient uptake outer membrane protein [Bacteroides fragilis]